MKTIVDEFERKTVEMHQPDGIITVTGWVYGEIGVLPTEWDGEPAWCLNCIPRGVGFPTPLLGLYRSIEAACGAAKALAKLNNCWALTNKFTSEQIEAMRQIGEEFGGYTEVTALDDYGRPIDKTESPAGRPFLNGASPEQYQ